MRSAVVNAVSELVQAAEEINRRPELIEDIPVFSPGRGPGLFVFPKDSGLSQLKVWRFK